jgi:hypothetical protein
MLCLYLCNCAAWCGVRALFVQVRQSADQRAQPLLPASLERHARRAGKEGRKKEGRYMQLQWAVGICSCSGQWVCLLLALDLYLS